MRADGREIASFPSRGGARFDTLDLRWCRGRGFRAVNGGVPGRHQPITEAMARIDPPALSFTINGFAAA